MKKNIPIFNRSVLVTIIFIVVITVNTAFTITKLKNEIEQEHLDTLWSTLDLLANTITKTTKDDQRQLEITAHMIGAADEGPIDSAALKYALSFFNEEHHIRDLYLLLPDNRLLSASGNPVTVNTALDFEEEQKKGSYVSQRMDSFADLNETLIYHAVPVFKNGKIQGILYGIVKLDSIKYIPESGNFDEELRFYLLEGNSQNFLLDTLHASPSDRESVIGRSSKHKGDIEKTRTELLEGKRGMSVFRSNRTREYLYFCYKPVAVNDWRVAVSLPESVVFENMHSVKHILITFTILEFSCIFLYLMWILNYNRKEAIEKNAQLTQVNYMFDIQKTLFDVYQNPEHMQLTLEKIKHKLQAENAFFIILEGQDKRNTYNWSTLGNEFHYQNFTSSALSEELYETGKYLLYDITKLKSSMPETYRQLKKLKVHNFMLTLVREAENNTEGILGAWNMKHRWKDTSYLEYVSANFFLAYQNIKSHETLTKMASMDMLTGLLNRNCHEAALKRYQQGEKAPCACIYIDVNGLHEVNNLLGHAAGDEMLRFIAKSLQEFFGETDTYRIGGDEFLAFVFDSAEEDILEKIRNFVKQIEEKNYHLSIGFRYQPNCSDINQMISEAEKIMYEEKRLYYQNGNHLKKIRQMNQKLEDILLSKKDTDTFLSLMAPRFVGVYVVDLENDSFRSIYAPKAFEELLNRYGGRFLPTIQRYIKQTISEADQNSLEYHLHYEYLKEELYKQEVKHISYTKFDGTLIQLHIYRTALYNNEKKETVWIFEKKKKFKIPKGTRLQKAAVFCFWQNTRFL